MRLGHQVQDNRQNQKDSKNNARRPRQYIARFRSKCRVAARATKGAGQPPATALLDQYQQDQKKADEDKERRKGVKEKIKHVH